MRNLSPRALRPRAALAARRFAGSRSAACACRFSETLQRENELFETHLRRVNPELLDDDHALTFGGRKGASKRGQAQLSAEQKYEIAAQEYEELRDELETSRKTADKLVDTLKAQLEETEVRIAEVKKDAYEFKRDIVTGAENLRTGKTIAEKAVRYAEDKLRGKGATAEKLRLKNAALKAQIAKMESQLQQKEDMGEVLHVIDFDQLKIENQQCAMMEPGMAPEMVLRLRAPGWSAAVARARADALRIAHRAITWRRYLEKIEERNNELLRLKLTTGNTVQVLNTLKHRLNNLTGESDWLKRETAGRKEARRDGIPATDRPMIDACAHAMTHAMNSTTRCLRRSQRSPTRSRAWRARRSRRRGSSASCAARPSPSRTCRKCSTTSHRRLRCTSSSVRPPRGAERSRSPRWSCDGTSSSPPRRPPTVVRDG